MNKIISDENPRGNITVKTRIQQGQYWRVTVIIPDNQVIVPEDIIQDHRHTVYREYIVGRILQNQRSLNRPGFNLITCECTLKYEGTKKNAG